MDKNNFIQHFLSQPKIWGWRMPVSFDEKQVTPSASTASDVDESVRTTQFFADRTRGVPVADQGGIERGERNGEQTAQSGECKDQPPGNGNALAMRFRAVHQKPQNFTSSEVLQVRISCSDSPIPGNN
jgi:hypothetical protein